MFCKGCQRTVHNGFDENNSGKCNPKYRQHGTVASRDIPDPSKIFQQYSTNPTRPIPDKELGRTFLTRFAFLLNPCALTAKLSVLSCRLSSRSWRSVTFVMLSRMMLTVSSIWAWMCAVLLGPPPCAGPALPARGT